MTPAMWFAIVAGGIFITAITIAMVKDEIQYRKIYRDR